MSGVIKQFPDRTTTDNSSTDYYKIVSEIAKLKRNELREFKTRFRLSMKEAQSNAIVLPYRMAIPRTQCGFLFIPLDEGLLELRQRVLQNLTYVCKYDLKLPKCIGTSFAPEGGGWYSVEWCYIEFPWKGDAELDERLRENSPFREVKTGQLNRYTYRD
jgi:hypothetical protein